VITFKTNSYNGKRKVEEWKRNLILMWVVQFFSIMGFGFSNPFAPFYLEELGVTNREALRIWTGLFLSSSSFSMILVTPIWGYLADRIGRKPMSVRAALGGTLAFVGLALAQTPQMLITIKFIQGIFTGTTTANLTLVVAKTPQKRMGLVIGVMNSSVFVGSAISPLIGGVLADLIGYRGSLFAAAFLLFLSFLIVLLLVRERFKPPAKTTFSFFSDTKQILFGTGILAIIGLISLFGFSRNLLRPIVPLLVQELATSDAGLATQAGSVSFAAGVAAILAGMIFGSLADRGPVSRMGSLCAALGGLALLPLLLVNSVWQYALWYFVPNFFIGGVDPILKVIVTRFVPEAKRGASFGIVGSAQSLGWGLGSLGGGIFAAFLGLRSVFVIGFCLFAVIAAFIFLLGKKNGSRT
jgi:DHA1 family multidrug resistance protein-like MFS transporter